MQTSLNTSTSTGISAHYSQFLDAGQLGFKWCEQCLKPHFYPRVHCPHCGNRETVWRVSSGKGRIYSFTIADRIAPAIIEMEEGFRLTSIIVEADVNALAIGDEVVVHCSKEPSGEAILSFTTPAANCAREYSQKALAQIQASIPSADDGAFPLNCVAIIGSGRMGRGIAMALINAGISVMLYDQTQEALDAAHKAINDELQKLVDKARISQDEAQKRSARIRATLDISDISAADAVIEAVWEQMELKKSIFAQIDQYAPPHAILCSNTSTLDIDQIASVTRCPERVLGLHFFNPAHVMRLIEVIKGPRTSTHAINLAKVLSNRLGKIPVVVGICKGFVGNRLMMARERQAGQLLLEGALPQQIDRVLRAFGLPMGTFELQDMAGGIAVNYMRRQESGEKDLIIDRLYETGRIGKQAGKGYYDYVPGKRAPVPSQEVKNMLEAVSAQAQIPRRHIGDEEIIQRLVFPMINEGIKLQEEGIVERESDIDMVWQYGYGWPSWKGGPMYFARQQGYAKIYHKLVELEQRYGESFQPARLLKELALNQ